MKITPLEIRQKSFEKNFRGYDKDEVNAFLLTLSQEWERVLEEQKEFRIKLESTEREVEKLREVENSLFKTLKTAEDTGANLIDQANKAADLQMQEAKMKATGIITEAKIKAKAVTESAENRARAIISAMEDEVKLLKQKHKAAENDLEDLLYELRNVAKEVLQKVDRSESKRSDRLHKKAEEAKELADEVNHFNAILESIKVEDITTKEDIESQEATPIDNTSAETVSYVAEENEQDQEEIVAENPEEVEIENQDEEQEEAVGVSEKAEKKKKSFFDEIE